MKVSLFIMLLFLAEPAVAQELDPSKYVEMVGACYDAAGNEAEARACKSQASALCMHTEEGGQTTIGMVDCIDAETQGWDVLLNREYKLLRDQAELTAAEYGAVFAGLPDQLRDAQRAWIALPDADCQLEYAIWGDGSIRHIFGATCMMEKTADRTFVLREWSQMMSEGY